MKPITAPKFTAGIIAALALLAVSAFAFSALFAKADTGAVVTASIQNGSNIVILTAPIGTPIHTAATVSSSTSATVPTGTVDFLTFPNTICSGQPSVTQTAVALVNGSAQSSTTTVPASGISYVVHYNGDVNASPSNSVCQKVTATAANNSINTTLSTTTSVFTGSTIHDSATLASITANAGGSVTYKVYTNNTCTLGMVNAGVKTVTNGIVPDSDSVLFSTAGTFYWQAIYSGDTQNAIATSSCQSEVLTVVNPTVVTPPVVTTPGTISGTVYNDTNNNGSKDAGEAGLPNFIINLYSGSTIGGAVLKTTTSDANGFYSFGSLTTGTYFVEEINQSGWNQDTSDMAVTLTDANPSSSVNFGNASTTVNGNGGKHDGKEDGDNEDNNDDDNSVASSTDNGGHDIGHFTHDFMKSHFKKGHDKGFHLVHFKNKNNHHGQGENDNND
jgi:hypothetical protein